MSASLQQQLADLETKIKGQIATLTTDIAAVGTEIGSLQQQLAAALAGMTPGTQLTQGDIDTFQGISTSLATQTSVLENLMPAPAAAPAAAQGISGMSAPQAAAAAPTMPGASPAGGVPSA